MDKKKPTETSVQEALGLHKVYSVHLEKEIFLPMQVEIFADVVASNSKEAIEILKSYTLKELDSLEMENTGTSVESGMSSGIIVGTEQWPPLEYLSKKTDITTEHFDAEIDEEGELINYKSSYHSNFLRKKNELIDT